jgi:hypothetical protein
MAQIINEDSFGSRLGQALGTGLGGGFAQGIQNLAQRKIQGLQQRSQFADLRGAGMNEQAANFLSRFTPEQQIKLIQGQDISSLFEPTEQSQALPNFAQALQTEEQQPAYQPANPQELVQQVMQKAAPVAKAKTPFKSKQQALQESKSKQDQLKQTHAEQKESAKESLNFYRNAHDMSEAADASDKRLSRMEKLIQKGNLPYNATYRLWKNLSEGVGGEVPILGGAFKAVSKLVGGIGSAIQRGVTATDTEEFEKLTADFLTDAKKFFGNRLTDNDVNLFLERVPKLSLTDEGKKKVINNMRSFNKAAKLKWDATKQIIKENGGKRPANLEILVEERIGDQLNRIAEDFREGSA